MDVYVVFYGTVASMQEAHGQFAFGQAKRAKIKEGNLLFVCSLLIIHDYFTPLYIGKALISLKSLWLQTKQ